MEEVTFRRVKALLPLADEAWRSILAEKTSRLYVAVLKHPFGGSFSEDLKIEDCLLLKGHTRLALSRIISAYKTSLALAEDAPLTLKVDGQPISDDSIVGQLPVREQFLVMTAHLDPPASQQSANSAGTMNPRLPLLPVTRQLTLPPAQSHDETSKAPAPSVPASPTAETPLPAPSPVDASAGVVKKEGPTESFTFNTFPVQSPVIGQSARPTAAATTNAEQGQQPDIKLGSPGHGDFDQPEPTAATPKVEDAEAELQYEPRDQGNPFAASQDEIEYTRGRNLQQLGAETSPERLEAGVTAGLQVLSSIVEPLKKLGENQDAQNWLEQVEKVRKDAGRTRTVVGVVGNTGAGKSSVINAMLEEERLVPTNCMRACTAVVTEMSYNESTDPNRKYRAVIEFIQPEDWEKELQVLFKEIFDDSGNLNKDISNADSDAGISYAKIRAVYHRHTREMLAKTTVQALMGQKHVKNVLGKLRRITEREPKAFYRHLQQYVDSKEKGTEKKDKNGNKITNPKREFEYWPLIKVVKIYTRSDALSTGAVIVDLPGVHDSNAARANVAQSYMKECTGLWIVAPINRAVDDKAAKTLLGDTFKRQLKYDGTYSAVTFICSKTDDISRVEASDSLNLGNHYDELDSKLSEIERQRKALRAEIKEKKGQKKDFEDTIDQIEEKVEVWEALADKLDRGKTVYPPQEKKRKRRVSSDNSSKRRRRTNIDSDDEAIDESPLQQEDAAVENTADPLTEEAINTKLEEFKQMKKGARREKNKMTDVIDELQDSLDNMAVEMDDIDAQQSALCIAGRNEYSRGAIQRDFAAGVRELDMEAAADDDPDKFNPDEDLRDYQEVATSLPVFCVSSRAYQKLAGRLQKDNDVPGFTTREQTEIPQLQAHCKKLTEKGRQALCRRFLNNLQSLLTSMSLWASDDGSGVKLTGAQRDAEKAFLARKLRELEKALDKTVTDTLEDAIETLNEQLFKKMTGAVKSAIDGSVPTSSGWGRKKDEGGLHFMTYRATVRRQGVFAGASGHRDFNAELSEPLYKHLASAWEKTFQRRLPHILQSCTKSATDVLKKFHAAIEQRVHEKGHGIARIGMIGSQLQAYTAVFGDLVAAAIEKLNSGQKESNREFTPVIANEMEPAYSYCADERGSGCYARMKSYMSDHVTNQRSNMFVTASAAVRKSLLALCDDVKRDMLDKADEVFVSMQRDYSTLVGVRSEKGGIRMSREERATRREVDDAIGAADSCFAKVLDAKLEDLQIYQQPGGDGAAADVVEDAGEDEMEIDDQTDDEDAMEDEDSVESSQDEDKDGQASEHNGASNMNEDD